MTDHRNEAADIAWMRDLAAENAATPPHGGAFLLAAGLIWGTASVVHWVIVSGLIVVPSSAFGLLWGVAGLVFIATLIVLTSRLKQRGGVETAANRAFGSVWSALGWGTCSLFTALMLLDLRGSGEMDMRGWSLVIPSIIMAFYGVGWAVSATMLRRRSLWLTAIGALVAAPLLALMAGSTEQYLAYAAALYLLMGVPGYQLMRAARQA